MKTGLFIFLLLIISVRGTGQNNQSEGSYYMDYSIHNFFDGRSNWFKRKNAMLGTTIPVSIGLGYTKKVNEKHGWELRMGFFSAEYDTTGMENGKAIERVYADFTANYVYYISDQYSLLTGPVARYGKRITKRNTNRGNESFRRDLFQNGVQLGGSYISNTSEYFFFSVKPVVQYFYHQSESIAGFKPDVNESSEDWTLTIYFGLNWRLE